MPITIHILSGSRRGEEICLDAREFRVGDSPQCEIYFDPRRDAAARGRSARFRLDDDGWTIRPDRPDRFMVNHAPVEREAHLRSGDVVRISESGPDIIFSVTSQAIPGPKVNLPSEAAYERSSADWHSPAAKRIATADPSSLRPSAVGRKTFSRRLVIAGSLAMGILAAVLIWFLSRYVPTGEIKSDAANSAVEIDPPTPRSLDP